MRIQNQDLAKYGISLEHATAFLDVAKQERAIILTRTPGPAALGLLAEGYDAKGFHIKGKSCDWGPMAGFICAEPLFNKSGLAGAESNLKAHLHSLKDAFETDKQGVAHKSRLVVLEISEARRLALVADKTVQSAQNPGGWHEGTTKIPGLATPGLKWALVRVANSPRWTIVYDPTGVPRPDGAPELDALDNGLAAALKAQLPNGLKDYRPVFGLSNPYPPYTVNAAATGPHNNAVTGDFDLFAVWPVKDESPIPNDKRITRSDDFKVRVGGMNTKVTKAGIYKAEENNAIGRVTGNISDGLYMIGQLLNAAIAGRTNQQAVNRIFHSDEAGRPGMDTVDDSVAFTPNGEMHAFTTPKNGAPLDFAEFALAQTATYNVYLNTGWLRPLLDALATRFAWSDAL